MGNLSKASALFYLGWLYNSVLWMSLPTDEIFHFLLPKTAVENLYYEKHILALLFKQYACSSPLLPPSSCLVGRILTTKLFGRLLLVWVFLWFPPPPVEFTVKLYHFNCIWDAPENSWVSFICLVGFCFISHRCCYKGRTLAQWKWKTFLKINYS